MKIIHSDVEIDRSLRFVVSRIAGARPLRLSGGEGVVCYMYVRRHAAASPCERWPHRLQQLEVCGVRDIYYVGHICVIARRLFTVRGVGALVIECRVQRAACFNSLAYS